MHPSVGWHGNKCDSVAGCQIQRQELKKAAGNGKKKTKLEESLTKSKSCASLEDLCKCACRHGNTSSLFVCLH